MSEQKPIPSGMLSNPQILGAIITGIITLLAAVVGILPQFVKNTDPTPTPLAGVVITFTPTPAPALAVLTLVSTVTDTPSIPLTPTPQNVDPTPAPSSTPTIQPSPTPESPTVAPTLVAVQAPNLRLFHNNRSFTVLNLHTRKVSLSGVAFEGGGVRWEASQWGPIYQDVTRGDCLRMRDQNSGQQSPPSECGDLLGLVLVGDGAIFWRADDGFTVSQDGVMLANCPQEPETCDVFIPQP